MNRVALLAYLQPQFAALVTATGQLSLYDDPDGYGPVIDATLREIGAAEDTLADPTVQYTAASDLMALARYYALEQFASLLSQKYDQTTGDMTEREQQLFGNVQKLLDTALQTIQLRGYAVQQFKVERFGLDFLEPPPTEFGVWS